MKHNNEPLSFLYITHLDLEMNQEKNMSENQAK